MAIKLEVESYCESCLDFEADVTKPERTTVWTIAPSTATTCQTDTIVKCKYAKRCEAIKRYLEKQKEAKE